MDTSVIWKDFFEGNHDAVLAAGATAVEAMHITGLSLCALGRFEEAHTLLLASVHAYPNPDWYANACVAFLEANQIDFALTYAHSGARDFTENANLQFNAGNVFTAKDNLAKALECFSIASQLDPNNWQYAINRANTFRRMGKLDTARDAYDECLTLAGDDVTQQATTRLNKSVTLSELGLDAEALLLFEGLRDQQIVDSPEMDFNISTLRLKLGDYKNGWSLYTRRWDCDMAKADLANFRKPILKDLKDAVGKRVLFCHEQGFGDSIQFCRYAPMFADHGIDVIIQVPAALYRLFQASFDVPVVVSRDDVEYDYECPMLNAPALFGTTIETIPSKIPYLKVPEELIRQRKLEDNGKLKIGIVWAGQSRNSREMRVVDNKRSIGVQGFLNIIHDNVDIYSLQFGERADDYINSLPEKYWPRLILEPNFDFLDTASVIMNLDLVIAVDTSTAHLAASLGKPVWLLSRFDGCWRWFKGRSDSPWYPPNLRIFNQRERLKWDSVMEEVSEALWTLIG
jgi:tetratricopeptide (TPR) repeat protein